MAYDEKLANRIREALIDQADVAEKTMFQGLGFMVEDKLCICVRNDVLLCRIGPDAYEAALEMNGVAPMIHNGKMMKGYVFVSPEGYLQKDAFDEWVRQCLIFNKVAKSSKKKK
ncbi:TfoX/Sxy family protein [Dyadobacter pollutisoli]|jgi:TfoX/Sxy family transcriptional regulator of competence genes|uniref:TfoX/Sxy family protein n=1 Tax=Dyadobacter pollutisoli TaxID=2910158 RepID=A0A9E8SKV9_9BACT|nr:TfoX/Sxy family protein [Dyadobacter pollutisoli]WAC12930.1 TfoX/Sxy family protein [Dyadobacter pollutisoli]